MMRSALKAESSGRSAVSTGSLKHVVSSGLAKGARSPALDYEVRLSEAVAKAVAAEGEPDALGESLLAQGLERDFPKEAQARLAGAGEGAGGLGRARSLKRWLADWL